MPASTKPDDLVVATIAFADPSDLPAGLLGKVDDADPDPAHWRLREGCSVADAGLFELWAASHSQRVVLGRVADVRALEALLAAAGDPVGLAAGWMDQAAAVATGQRALAVVPVDGALFMVAERLVVAGAHAMRRHRGVAFTVMPRPTV